MPPTDALAPLDTSNGINSRFKMLRMMLTMLVHDFCAVPPMAFGQEAGGAESEKRLRRAGAASSSSPPTAPTCSPSEVPVASILKGTDCDVFDFADSLSENEETVSMCSIDEEVPISPRTPSTFMRSQDRSASPMRPATLHAYHSTAVSCVLERKRGDDDEDGEDGDEELDAFYDSCMSVSSRISTARDASLSGASTPLPPLPLTASCTGFAASARPERPNSVSGPSSAGDLYAHRSPETGPTAAGERQSASIGMLPSTSADPLSGSVLKHEELQTPPNGSKGHRLLPSQSQSLLSPLHWKPRGSARSHLEDSLKPASRLSLAFTTSPLSSSHSGLSRSTVDTNARGYGDGSSRVCMDGGSDGTIVVPLAARPALSRSDSPSSKASSSHSFGLMLNDFSTGVHSMPRLARACGPSVSEHFASEMADELVTETIRECADCHSLLDGSVFMLHDKPYCSADCRLKGCRRESQSTSRNSASEAKSEPPPHFNRYLSEPSSISRVSSTGLMASYKAWM